MISDKVLVGKLEGMRPFERPKWRWEDKVEVDLSETVEVRDRKPIMGF
jgi:hypothetical protein